MARRLLRGVARHGKAVFERAGIGKDKTAGALAHIVVVSASSVWRLLSQTALLLKWNGKPSKKGTGFAQPLAAHQHWHIDVSYLNIGGTFYYLCSILDGFSRYIVNWDIRESMTEADIEILLQPRSLRSCLADGDSFEN